MIDIGKIVKKNISIIIPAAIALAALLLFIPTIIMRGKISTKLEESANLGGQVDSSLRTSVSGKQYEFVKALEDIHEADANELEKLAQQSSQRELLSYKIFPEPNETSIQIFNEFKKAYNIAFTKLIQDVNALDAPTDIEIKKQAGSIDVSTAGTYGTSPATAGSVRGADEKIIELICKRRSEEIQIYANPRVFGGYALWDNWEYSGTQNAVKNCWYSQLAYWIHQDVVDTIKSMNAGSTSTSESSVKRLLSVGFDGSGSGRDGGLDMPVYVTNSGGGLCQPWTTRKCNDQLDVIHFSLTVIVKADDVLKFMDVLCSGKEHYFAGYKGNQQPERYKHNQITILQSTVEAVDRNSNEHKKYVYGQNAIVVLDIICEYVFNRQGYDPMKPPLVQAEITPADTSGVR